jgi:hypothetical protein
MATTTVYLKRHDLRPALDMQLKDGDANALNVSTAIATSVTFIMKDIATGTVKVEAACTLLEPTDITKANGYDGRVRYQWLSGDTDTADTYLGEFEILYTDGQKLTVPTVDVLAIVILEDFNNG